MLNAFRHHGERDVTSLYVVVSRYGCSTPSGITASGTAHGLSRGDALAKVLNAFRHHGERDFDAYFSRTGVYT